MSAPTGILITGKTLGQNVGITVNAMTDDLLALEAKIHTLNQKKVMFENQLAFLITTLGELKTYEYSYASIKKLVEGKATFDDVVSLGMNILVALHKVEQLVQIMQSLQTATMVTSVASNSRTYGTVSIGRFRR